MGGVAASVTLIPILLGVMLLVAFDLFCLLRLAVSGPAGLILRLGWAAAIVCVSPLGGIAYLFSTRWARVSR